MLYCLKPNLEQKNIFTGFFGSIFIFAVRQMYAGVSLIVFCNVPQSHYHVSTISCLQDAAVRTPAKIRNQLTGGKKCRPRLMSSLIIKL